MALKIRLRQQGRTNRQTYRLVVTDIRCPRDGKYLEMVGWYNPFNNENDCQVQSERIQYWMGLGAQLTPSAEALIARVAPHLMQEIRQKRIAKQLKKVVKRRGIKKEATEVKKEMSKKTVSADTAVKKAPRAKAVKKSTSVNEN